MHNEKLQAFDAFLLLLLPVEVYERNNVRIAQRYMCIVSSVTSVSFDKTFSCSARSLSIVAVESSQPMELQALHLLPHSGNFLQ